MKKFISSLVLICTASMLFAISYKNNTYQKLADEYARKAELALDAGEYSDSYEYSQKAEENAELSKAYIQMMMVRTNAEESLALAENQLKWAESVDAPNTFPMAYSAAKEYFENARAAYDEEQYEQAEQYAKLCLEALEGVQEITPLPSIYIVRPWAENKDCFWNISSKPFVYNNPLLWENLYQSNKNDIPNPENPNLILPGMKMKIPSITGEYRSGTYDSNKEYQTYGE